MNAERYRNTLTQFLNEYWGAFHEVLEAQSVMPSRLSDSLFADLLEGHRRFAAESLGAQSTIERLGGLWKRVGEHRTFVPDAPLSPEQILEAREHFEAIYDALIVRGKRFARLREDVLAAVRHGTPREPLRADASR